MLYLRVEDDSRGDNKTLGRKICVRGHVMIMSYSLQSPSSFPNPPCSCDGSTKGQRCCCRFTKLKSLLSFSLSRRRHHPLYIQSSLLLSLPSASSSSL